MMKKLLVLFVSLCMFSCNDSTKKAAPENAADTIYFNGDIITMEGDEPTYVEAVSIKNGIISKSVSYTHLTLPTIYSV